MIINLIAAVSKNGFLGDADLNDIPWKDRYPKDFAWFRKQTSGHEVVFGRNTYESIGKPLPNRTNVVITRQKEIPGVECFPSLADWVKDRQSRTDKPTIKWLCGGENIYREGMLLAEMQYLFITLIPEALDCKNPVRFPWIDPTRFIMAELITIPNSDLNVAKYVRHQ